MIYYRTYITHTFLGYLFNLHNSNICRLLKKIEPLLAKKITITKDKSLTKEKILKILANITEQEVKVPKVIVDATEQQTQRPIKKQKKFYSDKKKKHTIKTEIVIKRIW